MGCTAAMGVTFSSPRDHALRGAAARAHRPAVVTWVSRPGRRPGPWSHAVEFVPVFRHRACSVPPRRRSLFTPVRGKRLGAASGKIFGGPMDILRSWGSALISRPGGLLGGAMAW
jgi:hypothetical protein